MFAWRGFIWAHVDILTLSAHLPPQSLLHLCFCYGCPVFGEQTLTRSLAAPRPWRICQLSANPTEQSCANFLGQFKKLYLLSSTHQHVFFAFCLLPLPWSLIIWRLKWIPGQLLKSYPSSYYCLLFPFFCWTHFKSWLMHKPFACI